MTYIKFLKVKYNFSKVFLASTNSPKFFSSQDSRVQFDD